MLKFTDKNIKSFSAAKCSGFLKFILIIAQANIIYYGRIEYLPLLGAIMI